MPGVVNPRTKVSAHTGISKFQLLANDIKNVTLQQVLCINLHILWLECPKITVACHLNMGTVTYVIVRASSHPIFAVVFSWEYCIILSPSVKIHHPHPAFENLYCLKIYIIFCFQVT
jgi:hypothetical protein